jgi:hypothetical protein
VRFKSSSNQDFKVNNRRNDKLIYKSKFNEYEIREDTAVIFLNDRKGNIYESYIDIEDLQKLIDFKYKWSPLYLPNADSYYAQCTIYLGKIDGKYKYQKVYMHQFVLDITDKTYVDHNNHNTLDNRKKNLRPTSNDKNLKHRGGKNSNNSSGYRNVSQQGKWWAVQLQVDGKNTVLKKFPLDQLDEAGVYAEKMRNELYGDFAGES